MELPEHGAFGVQEQGVQEHSVHAHQNIFALVGKVFQIVALHPDKIIGQREDDDFQQSFRHPDEALHILKSTAAQLFHAMSTHPFSEMSKMAAFVSEFYHI